MTQIDSILPPRSRAWQHAVVAFGRLDSRRVHVHRSTVLITMLAMASVPIASAQDAPPPPQPAAAPSGPQPFGANLFGGNYAGQREDGINPEYTILSGDRVMVNAWGAVTINDVFIVDTQGNIFLPGIGPVHLQGVKNGELTDAVRGAIGRVYRGSFGVYTNLLTASPVAVFVTGGVTRPGRYAGIPSDSVLFFLDQAGGIDNEGGSYRNVKVLRQGNELAAVDLYEFLLNGQIPSMQFEDGDTVLVGQRGPQVRVEGAGSTVLVEMTGDTFTGAEVLAVVGARGRANEVTVRGMRDGHPSLRSISRAALQTESLHDGDTVAFREDGRTDQILVRLEGEYRGISQLAVVRGSRLIDVLNHVNVDPNLANTGAVHIRRRSVAEEQRRTIHDSLDRLERSAVLGLSDTTGEAEIRVREAELVRQFVQQAREVEPLGRVVTSTAGVQLNIVLEEGDTIVIPGHTNVVNIGGEVNVTQAMMYRPDLSVRDYVRMAGGYTNRAATNAIIVIRPNAEVMIAPPDTLIGPGDQILVPPRIDRKQFQAAIDISRIIYEIAVATSVFLRVL